METDLKTRSPTPRWPLFLATAFLVIAPFDMPGGYYMLLRLVVCVVLAWLTWRLIIPKSELAWITGGFAVLYNPIVPVFLWNKGLWTVLNLATIVVLFWTHQRAGPAANGPG